jgi:hypothetical protein
MKEAEWLASTDVDIMCGFLHDAAALFRTRRQGYVAGHLARHLAVPRLAFSERKSRLFAVACCRRILHLMPTDEARACVLAAEQYADGLIDDDGLSVAVAASVRSCERDWRRRSRYRARAAPAVVGAINALGRVHRQQGARWAVPGSVARAWAFAQMLEASEEYTPERLGSLLNAEYARQADLLRDIVGNPFRPAAVEPAWLAWNDRCVERMAQGIYEERAFDRLPVLHDALLDAGCDNEDILAHCRTPEGHVRGCWVIDLLLGKA